MTTKQIKEAFEAFYYVFDHMTVNHAQKLLEECEKEERGHRGFMDNFNQCHTSDTISIKDAARLFAVKRVAEYLIIGTKLPSGKEYLHMQKSCFTAAGIADEFEGDIRKVWTPEQIAEYAVLDYTDFVKVRKESAA